MGWKLLHHMVTEERILVPGREWLLMIEIIHHEISIGQEVLVAAELQVVVLC